MMVPIWAPFLLPVFVALVVADTVTGGAVSESIHRNERERIRKKFGRDDKDDEAR